jgi:hypothetical protein
VIDLGALVVPVVFEDQDALVAKELVQAPLETSVRFLLTKTFAIVLSAQPPVLFELNGLRPPGVLEIDVASHTIEVASRIAFVGGSDLVDLLRYAGDRLVRQVLRELAAPTREDADELAAKPLVLRRRQKPTEALKAGFAVRLG